MAVSGFVKTNVSGAMTLLDGTTPTPLQLAIAFDQGNLNVGGLKEVLNEDVVIERRGQFVNVAHGNRAYPTFSFVCWVTQFNDSGTAPGNIWTFLQRTTGSAYAAAVSTLGAGSKVPFAFDLQYDLEGTDFGDSADHAFTLHDVQATSFDFTEAAEGLALSISGIVRGEIDGDLEMDQYTP